MKGWWGWTGHETRRSRPESAEQPQREQLRAPTGDVAWICAFPSGEISTHDSEQAAKNRAATTTGAVWYAALIESEDA